MSLFGADEHVPDGAGPVDDKADLPADHLGRFGQRARGFGSNDLVGGVFLR